MSKEVEDFWKYHNPDNMDVHAVKLINKLESRLAAQITEGNPEDNRMKFCPYCGRELKED